MIQFPRNPISSACYIPTRNDPHKYIRVNTIEPEREREKKMIQQFPSPLLSCNNSRGAKRLVIQSIQRGVVVYTVYIGIGWNNDPLRGSKVLGVKLRSRSVRNPWWVSFSIEVRQSRSFDRGFTPVYHDSTSPIHIYIYVYIRNEPRWAPPSFPRA